MLHILISHYISEEFNNHGNENTSKDTKNYRYFADCKKTQLYNLYILAPEKEIGPIQQELVDDYKRKIRE